MKKLLRIACLLSIGLFGYNNASAQIDSATVKMQSMMWRLIQLAPSDFTSITGKEVLKNEQATFYEVNLTAIVTNKEEMKKALATSFFGAMLTSNDKIVKTNGSTLYMARYKNDDAEFSIIDIVKNAFAGMTVYLGMNDGTAKVEEQKTQNPDEKKLVLIINGVSVAGYNYVEKESKGTLIIGIKK